MIKRNLLLSIALVALIVSPAIADPIGMSGGSFPVLVPALTATPVLISPNRGAGTTITTFSGTLNSNGPGSGYGANMVMLECYNPNAAVTYVQIHDSQVAGVTLGTSVPRFSIGLPPNFRGGFSLGRPSVRFNLGITLAATTTAVGLTAPAAPVVCNAVVD